MNAATTILVAAGAVLMTGLAVPANAGAAGPPADTLETAPETPLTTAALWVSHRVVAPGQVLWVAVTFEIKDGWHIYWPGLNDTGMPPIFDWHLPDGWLVGSPRFPVPIIHETEGGLVDHVLEGVAMVLVPIKVPEDAIAGQPVTISCDLEWLVCRVACLSESQRVQFTLAVTGGRQGWPVKDFHGAAVIDMAHKALPEPIPETGGPVAAALDGAELVITAADGARVSFYPTEDSREPAAGPAARLEQAGPVVRIALDETSDAPVEGVIIIETGDGGRRAFAVRIPEITEKQRDGFALPDTKPDP
jgi:DsbC/DsbD-like thiol-disulfide interchange protein